MHELIIYPTGILVGSHDVAAGSRVVPGAILILDLHQRVERRLGVVEELLDLENMLDIHVINVI